MGGGNVEIGAVRAYDAADGEAVMNTDQSVERTPSVEDVLAPFRQQVEESGMTDEELTKFGESLRREVHELRHDKS